MYLRKLIFLLKFSKLFPFILLVLVSGCTVAQEVQTVPAYPGPIKVVQPDGDTLRVRLYGDESSHFMTTEDGYYLVENDQGFYVYDQTGKEKKGVPSKVVAHNHEERLEKEKEFLKQFKPGKMRK
jgi:hypothetical protein